MAIRLGSGDPSQPVPRAQGPQARPKPGSVPSAPPAASAPSNAAQLDRRLGWDALGFDMLGRSLDQIGFVEASKSELEVSSAQQRIHNIEQTDHFYINGIRTDRAGAESDAAALTKTLRRDYLIQLDLAGPRPARGSGQDELRRLALTKVKYELLYNPTALDKFGEAKGTLLDGSEAIGNLTGIQTQIANQTAERFLVSLKQGRKLSVVAHSQGGAITADALRQVEASLLKTHSPAEVKAIFEKQVKVRTMGGFAPGRSFPAGIEAETLQNRFDYVPKLGSDILSWTKSLTVPYIGPLKGARVIYKAGEGLGTDLMLKAMGRPGVLEHHKTQSEDNDLGYINQIDMATPLGILPDKGK